MPWIITTGYIFASVCAAFSLTGCERNALSGNAARQPPARSVTASSEAVTYVYECDDGFAFVVRVEGETAWLFTPNRTVNLSRVQADRDSEYPEGEWRLWIKGAERTLEPNQGIRRPRGNNQAKAIREDAKSRRVDFRALGNEPGWNLEISDGEEIVHIGDYGQTE